MHDVRKFAGVEKFGDNGRISAISQHADLYAAISESFARQSSWARKVALGVFCTSVTPCVFCTVSDVIAATP